MMNRKLFRPRAKTQTGVKAKPFNKRGSLTPNIPRSDSRSDFELTSIFIRQQIDKKNYNEIVDTLRKLPRDYILKCLESFPFKALNRSVPHSFPIWETLLVKLHSSEEGYVAQLPCAACDELVIRIADILAYLNRHSDQSNDLYLQCKRVLKRVYIQYPDILGNLMKEYERLSRALYSLTLHIPLGTDASAKSLQEAICDDIHMTIKNLKSSLEDLEELTRENIGHVKQNGLNSRQVYNQRDIQERLYYNHCIARCALPSKIKSNLAQLLEMLDSRIQGDKDILALFASLRQRHETLTDAEPVEPCLRSYQASIECAISILQEIQNELAITSPSGSPDKKEDEMQSHFESYTSLPLSTSSLDQSQFPTLEPQSVTELQSMSRDKSSSENHIRIVRPLSAGVVVPRSLKGPYSEGISSSDQDLSLTANQPSLIQANRMGSAKRRGGFFRRSFRNSIRRLSSSTGNMSSKTKLNGNGASHVNENEEALKGELLEARETIQALRKRERELTDRLSEQAQRHLQESDRFEDILMGANRPTLVVQRYQEIYSQERVEAYDALTDIEGLSEEVFIPSLLLDILKVFVILMVRFNEAVVCI
jgi:hypothetical protein